MRKRFGVTFLAVLFVSLAVLSSEAKPRLAIRSFDNKTDGNVPAAAITEMMTTELFNAKIFTLVERERLGDVAAEIRLGQSGLVEESTAPELGKVKGAQLTMTGAITQYFYNASGGVIPVPGGGAGLASRTAYVTIDLRIINTSTGEIVYAAAEQGASNQTLGGVITQYGAFGSGKIGGILAAATRKAVIKHVESMKSTVWE